MQLNPSKIVEVGMGFWASKTLLAANKLGLFTLLAENGALNVAQIKIALSLDGKSLQDFLDALHALGFLSREGLNDAARYSNTPETAAFLSKNSPQYMGGFLEMANDREYLYWANLEEGLRTGKPQNEVKETGKESFKAIYSKEEHLKVFTEGMSGIQAGSFNAFSDVFDFSQASTLLDVGGSAGLLSAMVAAKHPHMQCVTYDLPELTPFVEHMRQQFNVVDRVAIHNGDFFEEDFPKADVITMGNILHSFDLEKKQILLRKAFNALPDGGRLVIIEMILDDERRENTFGLLMSLNMLIESDGGFNFTEGELKAWVKAIGFSAISINNLSGPVSLATITK